MKPIYVSLMWTLTTTILPCVLHDHNYSILLNPEDYLPCTLNLFAMTNLADLKDIEEDKENCIKTIPVSYGKEFTNYIILISLAFFFVQLVFLDHRLFNRICINLLM